jgi:hypothetical protein
MIGFLFAAFLVVGFGGITLVVWALCRLSQLLEDS